MSKMIAPFNVHICTPDAEILAGTVLLYWNAAAHEVEHALAAVGVYAPRGTDKIEWLSSARMAAIIDGEGAVIVWLEEKIAMTRRAQL